MSASHSSTKDDILQTLLKKGEATAQQLAQWLSISPQAVRRHLKDLESEQLIEHQVHAQGQGRPQHRYQLSAQGHERFPQGYGHFAVSFLETMTATVGKDQVNEVLKTQWQRKADEYRDRVGGGNLGERIQKLVAIRKEEGYMPELVDAELIHDEGFILAEHHCAISELAESYPNICGHELELFASVLPDCIIERTHWMNDGEHRCGYLIQPKVLQKS
ncbi:MAG: iron-sulfur cluster biosynthesis transcriptional regulator SufR [Cyanobacteria bacterium P01_H01_bin.15]